MENTAWRILCVFCFCYLKTDNAHAWLPTRDVSRPCTGVASALTRVLETRETPCLISQVARELLRVDIGDQAQVDEIMCTMTKHAGDLSGMFTALDSDGVIDKMLRAGYGFASVWGSVGNGYLRQSGAQKRQMECPTGWGDGVPKYTLAGTVSGVSPEQWEMAADTINILGLWTMDPAGSRAASQVIYRTFPYFAPTMDILPDVCVAAAVSDSGERCRMLKDAMAPFVNFITTEPQRSKAIGFFEEIRVNYKIQFARAETLEEDINAIICGLGASRSLGDLREFVDELGWTQSFFETLYMLGDGQLASMYRSAQYNIGQAEEENSHWAPSEEKLEAARAMVTFYEAYKGAGLTCPTEAAGGNWARHCQA